ncbi:hypothetical protein QQ045_001967 [Rhodiola kirilowii]
MGYGRLGGPTEPPDRPNQPPPSAPSRKRPRALLLSVVLSVTLLIASAIAATLFFLLGPDAAGSSAMRRHPSKAIAKACEKTRYPTLCVDSLVDFPGALAASEPDLVHISVNMTLQRFGRALYATSDLTNLPMDSLLRSAYDDCLELLDDSVDALTQSLSSVLGESEDKSSSAAEDAVTWLSAALTNHDTCTDGLELVSSGGSIKNQMVEHLKELAELVSNSLAIFSATSGGDDLSGIPIQNRRRRLSTTKMEYPKWIRRKDRLLLKLPVSEIQADIVVSKDGNGKACKTIREAIKKAPEHSKRRTIIYVKQGRYEEKMLKVGKKKKNLMFIGDGMGKTVITSRKNVLDHNITTFKTASFAATGAGFIARDITFENYAGPQKHQAVALRVGADHSVIYRCNITGYQDTLYVHSQRQFYRECEIYGTVDFIFGNAAVVFQNCSMYARKPMDQQKNTITAQNRKDPNQNTGISIHDCRILAQSDLEAAKANFSTYLGRPWKLYSRTVYMLSFIGDHVHPRGWLEWNATFALDTLYYGEYMNYGPGAGLMQRVTWPGYHIITSAAKAKKFTVARFIHGSTWLPSTGVAYLAGLSG